MREVADHVKRTRDQGDDVVLVLPEPLADRVTKELHLSQRRRVVVEERDVLGAPVEVCSIVLLFGAEVEDGGVVEARFVLAGEHLPEVVVVLGDLAVPLLGQRQLLDVGQEQRQQRAHCGGDCSKGICEHSIHAPPQRRSRVVAPQLRHDGQN